VINNQGQLVHPYPFGTHVSIVKGRHSLPEAYLYQVAPTTGGGWRYRAVFPGETGQRANVYDDEIAAVLGHDEATTAEWLQRTASPAAFGERR